MLESFRGYHLSFQQRSVTDLHQRSKQFYEEESPSQQLVFEATTRERLLWNTVSRAWRKLFS